MILTMVERLVRYTMFGEQYFAPIPRPLAAQGVAWKVYLTGVSCSLRRYKSFWGTTFVVGEPNDRISRLRGATYTRWSPIPFLIRHRTASSMNPDGCISNSRRSHQRERAPYARYARQGCRQISIGATTPIRC